MPAACNCAFAAIPAFKAVTTGLEAFAVTNEYASMYLLASAV